MLLYIKRIALPALSIIGIITIILFACTKEDLIPDVGSEEPTGDEALTTDPENENDTLIINAAEFIFPVPKPVGQGVTWYHNSTFNNACGGIIVSIEDAINVDVLEYNQELITFVVTGTPVWLLDFKVACVNDTTVYDLGYIIGDTK